MEPIILASEFEISTRGDVQTWEWLTSTLALAIIIGLLLLARSIIQYRAIEHEQRLQLRTILPQLLHADRRSTFFPHSDGLDRDEIRDGVEELADGIPDEDPSMREAADGLIQAIASRTGLSPLALKGILEGVAILALGLVVFVSLSFDGGTRPSASVFFDSYPRGWTLAFALAGLAFIGADLIFRYWWILAGVLVTASVALAYLDVVTEEDLSIRLFPSRTILIGTAVATGVAVYLAGAIPYLVGQSVGAETIGFWVGSAASVLTLTLAVVFFLNELRIRIYRRQHMPDRTPHFVAAYLLIRRFVGLLFLVGAALLALIVGYGIFTGALISGLLDVPIQLLGLSALVVLGGLIVISRVFGDEVGDLKLATRRMFASSFVRGFVFARGVPVLVVGVVLLTAWSLFGIAAAAVLAILAGALARLFTFVAIRGKYGVLEMLDGDRDASDAVVEWFEIEDADERTIYVAGVNDHYLAHPDREQLVESVVQRVAELHDPSDFVPSTIAEVFVSHLRDEDDVVVYPSIERAFYREMSERGVVDVEQVEQELRGDCKTRIIATLSRSDGEVDQETLEREAREEYPREIFEEAIDWWARRGEIARRGDKYVLRR